MRRLTSQTSCYHCPHDNTSAVSQHDFSYMRHQLVDMLFIECYFFGKNLSPVEKHSVSVFILSAFDPKKIKN